jgi:hypothetical protein
MQMHAQEAIHLSKSHNPTGEQINYVVDFLQLDSSLFFSFQLQKNDIMKWEIINRKSEIIVETRLLIILDGRLLSTKKEKKKALSVIDKENIKSIKRIDEQEAIELYGTSAVNGALIIQTQCYPDCTIQVYYHHGVDGIGGIERRITVCYSDSGIVCQFAEMNTGMYRAYLNTDTAREKSMEYAIQRYYQENENNYQMLEANVKISNSQSTNFLKILDEIKNYKPEDGISTSLNYYLIKDKEGSTIIIDCLGQYNRCADIENALGLRAKSILQRKEIVSQYNTNKEAYQQKFSKKLLAAYKKTYKHCTQDSIDCMLEDTRFVYIPQFFISYKHIKEVKYPSDILTFLKFNKKKPYGSVFLVKDTIMLASCSYFDNKYHISVSVPIDVPNLHIEMSDYHFDDHISYINTELSPDLVFVITAEHFLSESLSAWWMVKNENLKAIDILFDSEDIKFYDGYEYLEKVYQEFCKLYVQ